MVKKKRLLVISADAMVNEDLEYLSTLPGFKKYLEGGARIRTVRSIYPTLTYPAHASILTGCYPHRTGIVNNIVRTNDPTADIWEWDSRNIQVEDIFAAAKKVGYTTAAVLWPVTGNNPNIDYLVNEYWMPYPGETLEGSFRDTGSCEEVIEIIKKNERYLPGTYLKGGHKFASHPVYDEFGIGCACDIIRQFKPEVFFIHTSPIDNIRHRYGLFNDDHLKREIRRVDDQIRRVCEALEEVGVLEETNIVLLSDHGHIQCTREVNINAVLIDKGLLKVDENGNAAENWNVYCQSAGFSGHVYLQDPSDEANYKKTYETLKEMAECGLYGISKVYTAEEIDALENLNGDFSFVIETDDCTAFSNSFKKPYARSVIHSDYRYSHSKHGHHPDKGPQPVFVAKGPDFEPGVCFPSARLVDEAPTFAFLLGTHMTSAEGEPVLSVLRAER